MIHACPPKPGGQKHFLCSVQIFLAHAGFGTAGYGVTPLCCSRSSPVAFLD